MSRLPQDVYKRQGQHSAELALAVDVHQIPVGPHTALEDADAEALFAQLFVPCLLYTSPETEATVAFQLPKPRGAKIQATLVAIAASTELS